MTDHSPSPQHSEPIDTPLELLRNHRGRVLTYHELYRKNHHSQTRLNADLAHADMVILKEIESYYQSQMEYQTRVNKIRTLSTGKEVWGVRIAHDCEIVYSDIADSEQEAQEKLRVELEAIKRKRGE